MRQFVSSSMPDRNGRIVLSAKEHRYLSRVLRLEDGSYIDVRLPGGSLIKMKLHTGKTESLLETEPFSETGDGHKAESRGGEESSSMQISLPQKTEAHTANDKTQVQEQKAQPLWLFQFLPKVQKTDLIVRQATECGISRIIPIRGAYSPAYTPRIERWQRIIREARQQSGSPIETEINAVLCAEEAAALWEQTVCGIPSLGFILCEREEGQKSLFTHIRDKAEKIRDAAKESDACSRIFTALAVGCEGGISPAERNRLEQSGFVPIHLKTNILRAETAALYGLSAIQSALTEYRAWKLKE